MHSFHIRILTFTIGQILAVRLSVAENSLLLCSILKLFPGGLVFDTPVIYKSSTDYWGDNDTLADELWNDWILIQLW